MASVHVKQALEILARFIPEARKARLKSIAQKRSTHVALLLENIVDFGNHNAALRTMEALGLQSVHSVYELLPIVLRVVYNTILLSL